MGNPLGTQHTVRTQTQIHNTKQKIKKLSITDPIKNLGMKNGQSIGHATYSSKTKHTVRRQAKHTYTRQNNKPINKRGVNPDARQGYAVSPFLRDTRHGTLICFNVMYDTSM